MSFTLTGRIETRLAATCVPLVAALALHRWWAVDLVALMLLVGVVLDSGLYDRVLPYQPAWVSIPAGALELGVVYGAMRAIHLHGPLGLTLALFGLAWVTAQLLAQAILPRLRLTYAEAGGELGAAGLATAAAVCTVLVVALGAAYAVRPPTIHLHGHVRDPLVVRHAETLVGGTVDGPIVIRASHVTLRHVTVIGGENSIDIRDATHVLLDHVRVLRSESDGIHVRNAAVMITGCAIADPAGPWVQGIDISYSLGRPMSVVSECTIAGVREGIVTHSAAVDVMGNRVLDASLRGIVLGEMSMGMARGNEVDAANGVGILCLDHSMCDIEHNVVAGTRVAPGSDRARAGIAIEAHSYALATLAGNAVFDSPGGVAVFDGATIRRRR